MNKQIEGLPKNIQIGEIAILIHIGKTLQRTAVEIAEAIYEEGYRKSSEEYLEEEANEQAD